jgi:thioredoxin 1
MKTPVKVFIIAVLGMAVVGMFLLKKAETTPSSPVSLNSTNRATVAQSTNALPRLMDFGAGKCIPCKMMAPILKELEKEYAGKLDVVFIDVWLNPDAGKPYGIDKIPTQIFYDSAGKELYRHEGFLGKEDILAKWKSFGVDLAGK